MNNAPPPTEYGYRMKKPSRFMQNIIIAVIQLLVFFASSIVTINFMYFEYGIKPDHIECDPSKMAFGGVVVIMMTIALVKYIRSQND